VISHFDDLAATCGALLGVRVPAGASWVCCEAARRSAMADAAVPT
jgi:hypothetical protein